MTRESKTIPIFPSYIHVVNNVLSDTAFKAIQKAARDLEQEVEGLDHGFECDLFSTIRSGHTIARDERFLKLNRVMVNEASQFLRNLQSGLLATTGQGWLNCYTKDFYQELHVHPGSAVSGVFFVDSPEGSANLTLKETHFRFLPSVETSKLTEKQRIEQEEEGLKPFYNALSLPPIENTAVFFLSDQPHRVGRGTNTEMRRSIAYNYHVVRDPQGYNLVGGNNGND